MSTLSRLSGIHISRHGVHIEPLKALGTALTIGSLGGYGPIAAGLSQIPGGAAALGGISKIGAAARALPGAAKIAGGVSAVRRVIGGGEPGVPQVMRNGQPITLSDINPNIPAPAGGGASSSPSGGGGTDWMGLAEGGLAGLQAYNSAKAAGRAGQFQQQALDQANARYAEGAPLRAMGRAKILNPVRPDLTSVYNDPTNAFSKPATTAAPAPAPLSTASALPRRRLLPQGG